MSFSINRLFIRFLRCLTPSILCLLLCSSFCCVFLKLLLQWFNNFGLFPLEAFLIEIFYMLWQRYFPRLLFVVVNFAERIRLESKFTSHLYLHIIKMVTFLCHYPLFYYSTSWCHYLAIPSLKELAGLNAGMLWAGMMIDVFLLMLRAVFSARIFTMNEPKPRRYTFSPCARLSFTTAMNCSTTERTAGLSMPFKRRISKSKRMLYRW